MYCYMDGQMGESNVTKYTGYKGSSLNIISLVLNY